MNLFISFIAIFFLNSCNQVLEKSKLNISNKDTNVNNINKEISLDSLYIEYWKGTDANEYYFKYFDGVIQISSQYFSLNMAITNEATIKIFLDFIDAFFIEKTQEIVLSKEKRIEPIVTDYNIITIQGYKGKKEVFYNKISIGEENYKIEFNPKFLKFCNFLDELITQK